jgi:hypothetical protein
MIITIILIITFIMIIIIRSPLHRESMMEMRGVPAGGRPKPIVTRENGYDRRYTFSDYDRMDQVGPFASDPL